MVFQHAALFDSLTVGENVGFSLLEHSKLSDERIYFLVKQALTRVGLADVIGMYVSWRGSEREASICACGRY